MWECMCESIPVSVCVKGVCMWECMCNRGMHVGVHV